MNIFGEFVKLFGYHLVNVKKVHYDVYVHLFHLFNRININCVVDVGANVGQYGRKLRKFGYSGDIFSFEPVKSSFEKLTDISSSDPKWHVFNFALGNEEVKKKINISNNSDLSSFLEPNEYSRQVFQEKIAIGKIEEVEVRRLDDWIQEITGHVEEPRVFLKMDTQGFDLEVMKGARGSVGKILALQSELAVLPLYDDMPNYLESLQFYRDIGFEVSGLYPLCRDDINLVTIEFDCVMVKTRE